MMSKKTNKVYILAGVRCLKSNWNADFSGFPKTLGDGRYYGSSNAFKYSIREYWKQADLDVFITKTLNQEMIPMNLEEVYNLHHEPIKKEDKKKEDKGQEDQRRTVSKNLLSHVDVLNFGIAFAVKTVNLSFTGVAQVGQGFNVYEEAEVNVQDILSPFRNSNKDEAKQSTMGTSVFVDEAHYLYPISVNPNSIKAEAANLGIDGYTEEAYELLKEGIKKGATVLNSLPKQGCSNEFALFIELVEGSKLYLPNLDRYTTFRKEDKDIYDISKVIDILNHHKDQVKSIEIYTDTYTVDVVTGETDLEITYHSIF